MEKKQKKPKTAKKKVQFKDLKVKDAGKVKGGLRFDGIPGESTDSKH